MVKWYYILTRKKFEKKEKRKNNNTNIKNNNTKKRRRNYYKKKNNLSCNKQKTRNGNKGTITRREQHDSKTHTVSRTNIHLGKLEHRLIF